MNTIAPTAAAPAALRSPATWVLSLYFLQGLPFFMVNVVAGQALQSLGVANDEIARWTGLLGLAWAVKPLWSPLLEAAPSKKWLVVAFQFAGAAALGALAFSLQLPLEEYLTRTAINLGDAAMRATVDSACSPVSPAPIAPDTPPPDSRNSCRDTTPPSSVTSSATSPSPGGDAKRAAATSVSPS